MTIDSTLYDVVIIGGGPSGMMAALSVRRRHPEYSVLIIDRTFELGRKLLVTGAGRGNITNINLLHDPEKLYHGDQQFIQSVFTQFPYNDILKFFDGLGVPLYEEKKTNKGKMFPVINHAKTIRDLIVDEVAQEKVTVIVNTTVTTICRSDGQWKISAADIRFLSKYLIISTGGRTYPSLGSDGTGYDLLKSLGHTIISPVPSAVPLVSKNPLSHLLQGEKMTMQAEAVIDGKPVSRATGDVMFTQYGYSGPAVFDISRDISIRINREGKQDTKIRLHFFPGKTPDELTDELIRRFAKHPGFPVAHCLWGLLPQKVAGAVCAAAKLPIDMVAKNIKDVHIKLLIGILTSFEADVTGTRGWNEAEFTAGGVDTHEMSSTLESKKVSRLYIAGELLDVDGPVGGYNLSWAWASGFVAGKLC
jgi:predicted Rossmann fold flavoprotein